jgi:hypothetical protein
LFWSSWRFDSIFVDGYEPTSGAFCGCYIFDSEESREAFGQSELARTLAAAYKAEEVRAEAYEVLFPLYEVPLPAGSAHPLLRLYSPGCVEGGFYEVRGSKRFVYAPPSP